MRTVIFLLAFASALFCGSIAAPVLVGFAFGEGSEVIQLSILASTGTFVASLVLAATLGSAYGLYCGFELCEGRPVPGKEEYLDSEKYQLRHWDWDRPGHIRDDIGRLNAIRRRNPALQQFTGLTFYNAGNDQILYYGKHTEDLADFVLVAVNLDPHASQSAAFEVPLWEYGLADWASIGVEDLISGARFTWTGKMQHVELDPTVRPYAIWRLIPPGRDH